MKSIITIAASALLIASLSGQAQARTETHYFPKSGSITVQVPDDVVSQKAKPAPKAAHLTKQKKTDVARCNTDTRKLAC